jgi:hypothetical protein
VYPFFSHAQQHITCSSSSISSNVKFFYTVLHTLYVLNDEMSLPFRTITHASTKPGRAPTFFRQFSQHIFAPAVVPRKTPPKRVIASLQPFLTRRVRRQHLINQARHIPQTASKTYLFNISQPFCARQFLTTILPQRKTTRKPFTISQPFLTRHIIHHATLDLRKGFLGRDEE